MEGQEVQIIRKITEIEPIVMSRQKAAKFLCMSADHLDELESLPEFPEDCVVYLNPKGAIDSPRKKYKHFTVAGLKVFVANCIATTRKIRSVEKVQRNLEG